MPRHELTDEERKKGGHNSKRKSHSEQLAELAQQKIDDEGCTYEVAIDKVLVEKARAGDFPFLKEYYDRRYGKAKNHIELTGQDGGPIDNKITIEFVKSDSEVS